jgi:hypothetical protein
MKAYGRWNRTATDAQPVRDHIANLAEAGIGWMRAAELAGLPTATVSYWLYGSHGQPPAKDVTVDLAAKMLAVRPTLDNAADGARIEATGTRRRLQALVSNGWPMKHLARLLGISGSNSPRLIRQTMIEAATARAVRDLFAKLWDVKPEDGGVRADIAERARKSSAAKGWMPPQAWTCIDDPGEVPTDWRRTGERRGSEELVADAEEIRRTCGIGWTLVAERLGVKRNTLDKARERVAADRAKAGSA